MTVLPSGLPANVEDNESVARFLTQSNYFNSLMVKPAAFLPYPRDRETSVSRHNLDLEQLWESGRIAAGARKLYGAAILKVGDIRKIQLDVTEEEPPDRHAVIVNWPWIESDPELQKAEQKKLALVLASAAGKPVLL